MAKIREKIELNKTNKSVCGQLDILCSDYRVTKQKYDTAKHDLDLIKENIKGYVSEDADYTTTQYRIVVSIQPAKTEFKYDIEKILKAYPEIKNNENFGKLTTKDEIKSIKNIEPLEKK